MAKIYERVGGIVYEREFGGQVRTVVSGGTCGPMSDTLLWSEIKKAAETNPALQEAVDRVKVLYYLSKDHGNSKKTT